MPRPTPDFTDKTLLSWLAGLVGEIGWFVEQIFGFGFDGRISYFHKTQCLMALHVPAFLTNRTRIRTLLYLLLWAIMVLLNAYDPTKRSMSVEWLEISFSVSFWLIAWFEHSVVLTRFLNKRQIGWAFVGSAGAILCFVVTRYLVEQVFYWRLFGFTNYDPDVSKLYYAWDNRFYALLAVGMGLAFKIIEDWFVHQQERAELVSERNTAELAFLKSQVNPHFLFNTLNNIYSLAYTKSDAAPGAILKLSELMRYMLYESSDQTGRKRTGIAGKRGELFKKLCRT